MNSRRRCRGVALQALYQCDSLGDLNVKGLEAFFGYFQKIIQDENSPAAKTEEDLSFARLLATGVIERLSFLDRHIGVASTHWSIARMPRVDRNILRIATYEIAFCDDIPAKVSINEAIEIAKCFSSDESPMFINGVLNQVCASFTEHPSLLQEELLKGSYFRAATG